MFDTGPASRVVRISSLLGRKIKRQKRPPELEKSVLPPQLSKLFNLPLYPTDKRFSIRHKPLDY
jgi:hypothetical protein